jgi:NDP-sugar pyrophosphorylase family protein
MARALPPARRMDAMIFAAGLGTRLRPLTNTVPKALVPVGGVPMLERVARRLIEAGADRLIVNVHHHADQIERYIEQRDSFGVDVRISYEPDHPLDTGGGLKHAAHLFRRAAPFLLHNCDVLSDAPLDELYDAHAASAALVTLAVLPPGPSRYLIFDDAGLCGVARRDTGEETFARPVEGELRRFDFAGIHVAGPELLDQLEEEGVFSIVWSYLRLAGERARIDPFPIDADGWFDIGSFERLGEAEARLRR